MKVFHVVVLVLVLALALALGAGCRVPPGVPALPSKGGPAWTEVSSAHFTMWTDAPGRANALIQRMERLREVIFGTALFGRRAQEVRTFVVALANKEEVAMYLPEQFTAFATSAGALFQPVIVIPADALDTHDTSRIVTHELAHVISFGVIENQPPWFAEALASFYETADVDGTTVDLGKPLEGRAQELRLHHPLPLATLFACRSDACKDSMFYATAWALFTFLATEHAQELFDYMNLLAGTPEGADASPLWAKAFSSFGSLAAADHAFLSWVAHGKILVRQYTVKQATWPATDRPLGDADALAARGIAAYSYARGPLPKDIAAAIALDPNHVPARMIESRVAEHIPIEAARAIAVAHPDDWRVWFLLRRATEDHAEARTAHAKMCELAATSGAVLPPDFCR